MNKPYGSYFANREVWEAKKQKTCWWHEFVFEKLSVLSLVISSQVLWWVNCEKMINNKNMRMTLRLLVSLYCLVKVSDAKNNLHIAETLLETLSLTEDFNSAQNLIYCCYSHTGWAPVMLPYYTVADFLPSRSLQKWQLIIMCSSCIYVLYENSFSSQKLERGGKFSASYRWILIDRVKKEVVLSLDVVERWLAATQY